MDLLLQRFLSNAVDAVCLVVVVRKALFDRNLSIQVR